MHDDESGELLAGWWHVGFFAMYAIAGLWHLKSALEHWGRTDAETEVLPKLIDWPYRRYKR